LTRIEMQQLLEAAWRRESFTAILVTTTSPRPWR
jgi:ABC-type nitrate/sulfonate/bicarbonate transport system ATPase subunit